MSTFIPDANGLVTFIQNWTGSTNNQEIQDCIYMAELGMRNIELPALRTNPYTTFGVADSNGYVPIPADMNRPILFFNQGPNGTASNSGGGPWIVYDRIGDRDMIADQMIENLYLKPMNIPQVYRGKFSEVGQVYEFIPGLSAGAVINMYYFTTWPQLFTTDVNGNEVLTNAVLQSWPEGYVYGALREYYLKRKMPDDAAAWDAKYNLAWDTIEDQNNKGKWSGGNTRLTSIFQPRKDRRYTAR